MSFNRPEFDAFCSALTIESKEFGLINLGQRMLGTQRYFIDEVEKALARGIHEIFALKGRQEGISTICLALDLYWHLKHKGMQGTLVCDTEENREMFRTTLAMYLDALPKKWRSPIKAHNRVQLVFDRIRSRMVYQVAGSRGSKGFGAGKAIVFSHSTELGKWGEDVDISSFQASFAQTNPDRLFIWESTAYGMNTFEEMYEAAKESVAQCAIFIGWWRCELYTLAPESEPFKTYWDGSRTQDEKEWSLKVKELYDFDISDEQIAWWRFMLHEKCNGDQADCLEKYPFYDEQAFKMSGSKFFNALFLTDTMREARREAHQEYRFELGMTFEETTLSDANAKTVELKIWQPAMPNAWYSIGADPAWGSSEWADRFCIEVYRCWKDGMDQIGEFCTPDCSTVHYAWILAYLVGYYGDPRINAHAMLNLELNGPGMAVWSEMLNMKRLAALAPRTEENVGILTFLNQMENFTYRRPDSIASGMAWHTKTTNQEKERMLNAFKSYHQLGFIKLRSSELVKEMGNVVREDKSGSISISAPGRKKDDRVLASGLATLSWSDLLRLRLAAANVSREAQMKAESQPEEYQQAGLSVANYLKMLTVRPAKKPRPNALRRYN